MSGAAIGFIGLGRMGSPMAANLARAGHPLVCHDAAGTAERTPEGAEAASSAGAVAAAAETVLLSLPDGDVVAQVAGEMLAAPDRRLRTLVDTSTIGIEAARATAARCEAAGVRYVDAPVSGGVTGAKAGTVAVMLAGSEAIHAALEPLLLGMAAHVFRVGDAPGQGQATKLANNFLSATAMAATSEAVAFGLAEGLDMATMLDVFNVSTGQNTATRDKFPQRILSGSYDSGFSVRLLAKDLHLYRDALAARGGAEPVSPAVVAVWDALQSRDPDADMSRVYPLVAGMRTGGPAR